MSAADEFEHITTAAAVQAYRDTKPIFDGLLKEVRELSKKKPEATISPGKVKMINRVLDDLLTFLKDQPAGKYLDLLESDALPQMSDALLTMVQFDSALDSFRSRFFKHIHGESFWITQEQIKEWDDADAEIEADEEDEEEAVEDEEEADDEEDEADDDDDDHQR